MEIVKYPNLYFSDARSGKKTLFTKENMPLLYAYVQSKRETIVADYNEYIQNKIDNGGKATLVFPRLVVKEEFFDKLQKELEPKMRQRCFFIFHGTPDNLVTRVMGIGFFNEESWLYNTGKNRHKLAPKTKRTKKFGGKKRAKQKK